MCCTGNIMDTVGSKLHTVCPSYHALSTTIPWCIYWLCQKYTCTATVTVGYRDTLTEGYWCSGSTCVVRVLPQLLGYSDRGVVVQWQYMWCTCTATVTAECRDTLTEGY